MTDTRSLKEVLAAVDRKKLVDDVVQLIDDEVSRKGGVTGLALKGGYAVVKKLKGGRMIHLAADNLLDDFTVALDTIYSRFQAEGGQGGFTAFLARHEQEATNALLGITDGRAARAEHAVLKKTYEKLRPQAEKHVKEALPGVGRLVSRYM